jgi:hypothetical protein
MPLENLEQADLGFSANSKWFFYKPRDSAYA